MSNINAWSKKNKLGFNEAKSKIMLISKRKRKEEKKFISAANLLNNSQQLNFRNRF